MHPEIMSTEEWQRLVPGLPILNSSLHHHEGSYFALHQGGDGQQRLAILTSSPVTTLAGFEGEQSSISDAYTLLLADLTPVHAELLRHKLPWLVPQVQGLRTTAGLGDRLGLATPGHLRAVRAVGGGVVPLPAQQSIREMTRTNRTPQEVMDDAMWGVFAEGWSSGFGADADHLKVPVDIDNCLAAGYTFYTFDPGEHVVNHTEALAGEALREAYEGLPWSVLEETPTGLTQRILSAPLQCEGHRIACDEVTLRRAAVKYGRAVAHVTMMYRHLLTTAAGREVEVEVSVDETEAPTSHLEHVYIASELRRLGVQVVSLAPRYIGDFEKGVDYIGDLAAFEQDFAVHAAIARAYGPYKLSLHSGSDKFSIYEIAAQLTAGTVHLKTAGTSYLEALRTIAALDPALMREIYRFARARYEIDRASYHVSARLERAPDEPSLSDAELPGLLDQFDARQILHVTFGSVLTSRHPDGSYIFFDRFMDLLRHHREEYAVNLERHFIKHVQPLAQVAHST